MSTRFRFYSQCDAQEANGGGGGLIAYASPDGGAGDADSGKRQVIAFEGTDVKGRTGRLNKGDPVQFFITTDVRTGKRRATQVHHFPWLPHVPTHWPCLCCCAR